MIWLNPPRKTKKIKTCFAWCPTWLFYYNYRGDFIEKGMIWLEQYHAYYEYDTFGIDRPGWNRVAAYPINITLEEWLNMKG
jgi:hypothetical protein